MFGETKGPVDSTTRRFVAHLDWWVLHRLVLKSGQEPAIPALKHPVRESINAHSWSSALLTEHQLNGTIEVLVT